MKSTKGKSVKGEKKKDQTYKPCLSLDINPEYRLLFLAIASGISNSFRGRRSSIEVEKAIFGRDGHTAQRSARIRWEGGLESTGNEGTGWTWF